MDDSADDLIIGKGSTVGTTPAIAINENEDVCINGSSFALAGGASSYGNLTINGASGGIFEFANDGTLQTFIQSVDTSLQIIHVPSAPMLFGTNNTERMRIDASGNVGIGTSSPETKVEISGSADNGLLQALQITNTDHASGETGQQVAINFKLSRAGTMRDAARITAGKDDDWDDAASTDSFIAFDTTLNDTRAQQWRINSNGYFLPNGNNTKNIGSTSERVSVLFTSNAVSVSDRTLKTNIQDCDLGLDFINTLQPKSYKNLLDTDTPLPTDHIDYNKKHYGLIAQDLKDGSLSDSVCGTKDGEYSLAYNDLIAPMIKALQEADDKIDALTARIETLEGGE